MVIMIVFFFNQLIDVHIVVHHQASLDQCHNGKQQQRLVGNCDEVLNQGEKSQEDKYYDALKQGT